MFIKKSWNTKAKNPKPQYHIAESFRNENGEPRQRLIANITKLPDRVIKNIDRMLKGKKLISEKELDLDIKDSLKGAGVIAIYKLFKDYNIAKALKNFSKAEKQSVFAMVCQRIFDPGSKYSTKDYFEDNIFSRIFSAKRLDENELYRVMDKLYADFNQIQEALASQHELSNTLLLYDTTTTYFEGREVSYGEIGYSKDHRSDRYQIVIGLVCNQEGIPVSIEVWPGSTPDKNTVKQQVRSIKDRFGIKDVIFVGDKGMFTRANIDEIIHHGFKYIISAEWHVQQKQLLSLSPEQLRLFDQMDVVEWEDNGKRYIGCHSESRAQRENAIRENGLSKAKKELGKLRISAKKGKYYTRDRLAVKINDIVENNKVKSILDIDVERLTEGEGKNRFEIDFNVDKTALKQKVRIAGKYVIETSVPVEEQSKEEIVNNYKNLRQVEESFKNLKSFIKIRPVFHYKDERVKAHVLICYLAHYILNRAEIEFMREGLKGKAAKRLRDWNKLELIEHSLKAGQYNMTGFSWSKGKVGKKKIKEIKKMKWWKSIQGYKSSLTQKIIKPS